MAKDDELKKRAKRSSAKKRDLQNEKKRIENRIFKSQVKTAIRKFEKAAETQDKPRMQETLAAVYSLMDKGVKRRIFKLNKASRKKSRLSAKAAA